MQIHNNTLTTECSAYDFKEMLEHKKVKSWLKSVSAFANTDGGSLFYGVNDDGVIVGLENPQADADFISEMIKARLADKMAFFITLPCFSTANKFYNRTIGTAPFSFTSIINLRKYQPKE